MCGIGGFFGFTQERLIEDMSSCMKHRGPDGEGVYHGDGVTLLNRRLAIIDRAGGDQPIFNEDKSVVVVYNGEIYNYQELRTELEKAGHQFKTHSDTEVIVHGYEEWRDDCFNRFNGMFAIALYDIKKDRLLLVRDQFGIKPLYYADKLRVTSYEAPVHPTILFASELKPLLNSDLIEKKVNERILFRYLKFRIHDDGRETFFEGIHRLLPGEMLVVERDHTAVVKYSQLEKELMIQRNGHSRSLQKDDVTTFKQKLTEAVRKRLVSEVPVGTALSGGIDSSTIVALVHQMLKQHAQEASSVGSQQNTFSAVFPGCENDEEQHVDQLLRNIDQVKSHKVFPKAEDFFADLSDFVRTQEEPTISTGPYAQYQVMRAAKEHVTVLLDGQGADEMLGGYLPYYFVYLRQLRKRGHYLTLLKEVWSTRDILLRFFQLRLEQTFSSAHAVDMSSLMAETFKQKFANESYQVVKDDLKMRLRNDIFRDSLQSLLRYEDRNTMRFSLEGRVPFLDIDLMRYLFSLGDDAIIKNGWNKYILRKSMKELLPPTIRNRRNKIGFTTPEYEWFMHSKKELYELFLSESFANRPYWDAQKILKTFRLFLMGKHDDTMLFWRLINVEMWLREFIDAEKKEEQKEKKTPQFILGKPNSGKKIEIEVGGKTYCRLPIRTERFNAGDDYAEKIAKEVSNAVSQVARDLTKKWYIIVSEKIVAISQGRSYFIWDINPSWWAQTLSPFVARTPYGIGLGSPWTMQLAIEEVGLPRIILAAAAAVVTKPLGIKGLFYRIAGRPAAAIDGPTEYSLYPSNVSAKKAPKDPQKAAEKIRNAIDLRFKNYDQRSPFSGVVIIDANDIGREVLGNATDKPDSFFQDLMRDNPMGQGSEGTPVVIVL